MAFSADFKAYLFICCSKEADKKFAIKLWLDVAIISDAVDHLERVIIYLSIIDIGTYVFLLF